VGLPRFFTWVDMVLLDGRITFWNHNLAPTCYIFLHHWGDGRTSWRHSHDSPILRSRWPARPRPEACGPLAYQGRWWTVILLFFPALTLLAGILARMSGATQQPFDLSGLLSVWRIQVVS
jgi:hypothetical protein